MSTTAIVSIDGSGWTKVLEGATGKSCRIMADNDTSKWVMAASDPGAGSEVGVPMKARELYDITIPSGEDLWGRVEGNDSAGGKIVVVDLS